MKAGEKKRRGRIVTVEILDRRALQGMFERSECSVNVLLS